MGLPGRDLQANEPPLVLRVRPSLLCRHPLVLPAVALITGILLHEAVPVLPGLYALAAACFGVAALVVPIAFLANVTLLIAFVALGAGVAQSAHYRFADDHIAHYATATPRLADLELHLPEAPRLLRVPDVGRPRPPKMTAVAEVTAIRTWAGWQPASGTTLLQLDQPDPRLAAGDTVRLLGLLERPGPAVNPGQFDYENYYRGRRVLVSVSADGPSLIDIVSHSRPSLRTRIRERARECVTAGFTPQQTEQAALLKAMLLGERDAAMSDARELFRASGTSHYLAISGLHVGIVGGVVFAGCRLFGKGPRTSLIACGTTVAIYALLAAPSPPVLRATILALAFGTGLLMGRRAAGVQLLAGAAIVLLLAAPLDLYRAGFQLSFVTVLGLMLFGEAVRRRLGAAAESDAALLRRQSDAPLIRIGHWLDGEMLRGLAAALVAWLAAMPLVAAHFGQFNSWAIPASLAASPAVFASLVAGVLKLIATAALPELAPLWASLAVWPVDVMRAIVGWFASLPGADVPLPTPAIVMIVAFYAALLLARYAVPPKRWGESWGGLVWIARAPLGAAVIIVFVLPLSGYQAAVRDDRPLRVTLLAVGAGQCAVVETPAGEVTLIDAGSMSLGRPLEKCLSPFLRARGHAGVERIVLSHANFDHFNAASGAAELYDVTEVLVGPQFMDDAGVLPTGRALLEELAYLDRPPRPVSPGDVLPLGRDTQLRVLWPPADAMDLDPNDASLVVRLEHAGRRILFTGDIQSDGMRALLASDDPDLLRADVLIAPHHGSSESETADFIADVDPDYVLSSNSRALAQKQLRLADLVGDRPLLRTHETGAITVTIDGDGVLAIETFLAGERTTLRYPE